MKRALCLAPLALLALALAAAPRSARADEPRPTAPPTKAEVKKHAEERKENLKEKFEKKKEKLEEKLEEKKDSKHGDAGEGREEKGDDAGEKRDALRERWQKLRETRKERRREHREEIKKAWGDIQGKPLVKAELKLHAWRMARLNRIRAIADAEGKTETVARVDKLMEKEKQRHQKRMDHLKSKGGEE